VGADQASEGLTRPAMHRVRWQNGFYVFFFWAVFLNYDQRLDRSCAPLRSQSCASTNFSTFCIDSSKTESIVRGDGTKEQGENRKIFLAFPGIIRKIGKTIRVQTGRNDTTSSF
jgi:hypothetical protein